VAAAVKLKRHTGRRHAGRFLVEGPNLVAAARRAGLVHEVFVTSEAVRRHASVVAGHPVQMITDGAAKALSETVTPTGLVAVCGIPTHDLDAVLAGSPDLIAVAVDLAEPGNAGTLIRTAHAMGAAAVVFAGSTVDPYNGKCLRASAGSIFAIPVLTDPDVPATIERLRRSGLQTLATTVDAEISLDDADTLLASPTAWIFGAEAHGLSPQIADAADHRIAVPMSATAESLNVAAAAAICLYQSARSRRLGESL